MFRGTVNPRLEPVVTLGLIASDGQIHEVDVVLDSGFDGSLCLPGAIIRRLGFPLYDEFVSTLADGRRVRVQGYDGEVLWHGRQRSVLVLEAEGSSLLGMNLLWRNRVTIDAYANGPVVIEELE